MFLWVLLMMLPLAAQLVSYTNFERFNTEDGLPQNHINRIDQDQDGFIWVATPSGLARFDGYRFLVFSSDESQPNFLSSSNIRDIFIDGDNLLWIIHRNGKVDQMNPQTFQVTKAVAALVTIPKDQFVLNRYGSSSWIMGNRKQGQWFIEQGDDYKLYDDSNSSLSQYFQQTAIQPANFGFKLLDNGGLWCITKTHITFREDSNAEEVAYPLPKGLAQYFKEVTYVYLTVLDDFRILFSGKKDLFVFDRSTGEYHTARFPKVAKLWGKGILPASGATQQVNGHSIFAYQGNVLQYDPVSKQLGVLWQSPQSESLPISTLMLTDKKTLWVGVSGEGLYKVNLLTPAFVNKPYKVNFLVDILQSEIGMDTTIIPVNWKKRGGTYGLRTHYLGDTLLLTNDLGFKGARQAYALFEGRLSRLPVSSPESDLAFMGLSSHKGISMAIDQDGWLHQWHPSLAKANARQVIPIGNREDREKTLINDLVTDSKGQWVLTRRGALIQIQEGKLRDTYYPVADNSTFISLKQDPEEDSILWIGTLGDGLIRWNKNTRKASRAYTKKEGLIDDRIAGLVFDNNHQLWLSTFNGIVKFNRRTESFTNYTKSDGLQESEFNRHHAMRLSDGRIAFGGSLGYTIFDPAFFEVDTFQPKINIAALYLDEVHMSKVAGISLNGLDQLKLPYDNSVLTFELASSTYNNIGQTNYRYQLSGYTNSWVNLGHEHMVRLGKLAPGKYTLTFNASNSQGQWSNSQKQLQLIISPPPWLTWWAFVVYVIIFVGLVFLYWRSYRKKIIRQEEEAFNKREAHRLLELDQMKTRFFSNITHEFRTPLTLMLSPIEKYLENEDLPGATRKLLESNHNKANQLLQLVNQLLDIAKLEAGHMRSDQASGALLQFVKEAVDQFSEKAQQQGVKVSFEPTVGDGNYAFDHHHFERIIQNLMSNALKFTETGGQVWVRLFHSDGTDAGHRNLIFEVEDTGLGIKASELPRLFDRFYQTDDSATRQHEGTGIGLALVKELAELMGGAVSVTSTVGKGSKFTVTFPVRQLTGSPDKVSSPVLETPKPDHKQKSKSDLLVLVVEDNQELRAFLMESLAENYQVLGAENGKLAWEVIAQELPDVIISDVMMPYLNGFELCAKVKSDPRTMHIQVMLLTAKASQEAREEGLHFGADEYLTKPFHPKELDLRLANFQEKREALRRHLTSTLLSGKAMDEVPTVEDKFVQQLLPLIAQHLQDTDLDVAFVSRELGMSKSTLNRKMRAIFNLSTNQFIRNYRLQQSTIYLQSGYTVAEAALKVGFDSPSYFAQCFREQFQKSPSAFQKDPV